MTRPRLGCLHCLYTGAGTTCHPLAPSRFSGMDIVGAWCRSYTIFGGVISPTPSLGRHAQTRLIAMLDTDSSISILSLDLKASGRASKTAARVLRAASRPALLSGGPLGLSGLTNFFHRMNQGNGTDPVFTVGHMNVPLAVYQSAFSSA